MKWPRLEKLVQQKWEAGRLEHLRRAAHKTVSVTGGVDAVLAGFEMAREWLAYSAPVVYCTVGDRHLLAWCGLTEDEILELVRAIPDKTDKPLPVKTAMRLVRHHLLAISKKRNRTPTDQLSYLQRNMTVHIIRHWMQGNAPHRYEKLVRAASALQSHELQQVWDEAHQLLQVQVVQES